MRHQRALRKTGIGIMLAVLVFTGFFLHSIQQPEAANVMTRGRVKISIQNTEDGREIEPESEVETVSPGEEINRVTQITISKESRPAQLKVWVVTHGLNARQQQELRQNISLEEGWSFHDEEGCFTYDRQVQGGEEILFCTKVTVPQSWKLLTQMPVFRFQAVAEATEN